MNAMKVPRNELVYRGKVSERDLEANLASVAKAREDASVVVFSLHAHRPGVWVEDVAHRVLDGGADIFVVQPTCPPVNQNVMELLVLLAIPVSTAFALVFLYAFGIPLSNMVIFSYILVLGMVVALILRGSGKWSLDRMLAGMLARP